MRASIRTRLTLWYTGVLALVLLLFSIGVYSLVARQLMAVWRGVCTPRLRARRAC